MSFTVYISSGVFRALRKQTLFYENKRGNAGLKFVNSFDKAIMQLEENPYTCQVRRGKYRIIQLTPYQDLLVFSIKGNDVNIARLVHAKQHPKRSFIRS